MNWAAWLPAIITVLTAIFIAGQVTGRIKDQEKTQVEHRGWLQGHDEELKDHGERLARSEAWREGYAAGSGGAKPHQR